MTQEEKAKAYDEALEKARKIVNSINVGLIGKNSFEVVFPELADSEDERIRKELLQIAKESEDSFYMVMTPNKREKLINWLEKQCGQKLDWGERDEKLLNDAISLADECDDIELRDWLKSIKERIGK